MRSSKPTIVDVAKAAGVSIGTVSAVIHGKRTVNAEIRERVSKAIAELGYVPNALAQSMRFRSTRTIGVAVWHLAKHIMETIQAAQDVLYEAGYVTLVAPYSGRQERELDFIKALLQRQVDGFIISQRSESDATLNETLKGANVPIVMIDRDTSLFDTVLIDHQSAIYQATEHLLQLGHRRILLMSGDKTIHPSRERILAYEAAHKAAKAKVDRELIRTDEFSAQYGFVQTMSMMARPSPPTAIIASGLVVPGVLRALTREGLRIPEDISLVSCSDTELTELATPPITSERWNASEVGLVAAGLLLDRLKSATSPKPRRVLVPAEMAFRYSCAPPPSMRASRKAR